MAEFYMTKDGGAAAEQKIHKSNCEQLPPVATLFYLGSFASGEAAHTKARGYFEQISFCPTCFKS